VKTIINSIEAKLLNLINNFNQIQKENSDLQKNNYALNERLQEKEKLIANLQDKVKLMNISRSVDSDSEDVKATRSKINEYIREIDRCIALLNK
tara:strand:+ start:10575 stop:10856 length:282 start_codon:yes stop_codon:yes gene_type:complete